MLQCLIYLNNLLGLKNKEKSEISQDMKDKANDIKKSIEK